jgi:hypothetical protein
MQAVWVLAVSDDIINGHNGILTEGHAGALSEVMGMIDLYRNELPAGHVAEATAATAADSQTPTTDIETENVISLSGLEPATEQATEVVPQPVTEVKALTQSAAAPAVNTQPVPIEPVATQQ